MSHPSLFIDRISLNYKRENRISFTLEDFSMQIEKGRIACLLRQSGCGKSTILRAIARFEPIVRGAITINGLCVSSPQHHIVPERRQVGMVFQDYALFPHLDAFHNIAFGLRKKQKAEVKARVMQLLQLVGLEKMAGHYPHEFSGG